MKSFCTIVLLFVCIHSSVFSQKVQITGELKKWHKITLLFDGPQAAELDSLNPFTDYRLEVTFTNGSSEYTVPGHFAGDGKAANTSAFSGTKWRVFFSPNNIGTWKYKVSFKKGNKIALTNDGESVSPLDNLTGDFVVANSDKTGNDFRSKGRLQYAGEHYLQFADTKEYFVKMGADSPENILHFVDFDATTNGYGKQGKLQQFLKNWEPHAKDFDSLSAASFRWGPDANKGNNVLGALKYLANQGMNSMSLMLFSVDGDDRNVFPYILKKSEEEFIAETNQNNSKTWEKGFFYKDRFDVSKLDQWEKIFEYAEYLGLFVDIKLSEIENNKFHFENESDYLRKLYYREIISRFGHHLGIQWNVSEEISMPVQQMRDALTFIKNTDAYQNLRVIHTFPDNLGTKNWQTYQIYYDDNLGDKSDITGLSMQITVEKDSLQIHKDVKRFVESSNKSGKKWVIFNDEQGPADLGMPADPIGDLFARHQIIWSTLMAGGAGVNYYYGYKTGSTDLSSQDHRTRETKYKYGKYALDFFRNNLLPEITQMKNMNEATTSKNDFVFGIENKIYAVYMPKGGSNTISLPKSKWVITWFNPRNGETLSKKSKLKKGVFIAPNNEDWVALIKTK